MNKNIWLVVLGFIFMTIPAITSIIVCLSVFITQDPYAMINKLTANILLLTLFWGAVIGILFPFWLFKQKELFSVTNMLKKSY